ncbi:MAG: hypothetical protein WEB50_12835 [Vicinamibacterales bacterium]
MTLTRAEKTKPKTIASGDTRAPAESLTPAELDRPCDIATLGFRTTDELPDSPITLGQDRAVSAIQFDMGIHHNGYNLSALGPSNAGEHVIVRQFLHTPIEVCHVRC